MTYGSSALKNRDEKATDNLELKNWFAVLKNKEENANRNKPRHYRGDYLAQEW